MNGKPLPHSRNFPRRTSCPKCPGHVDYLHGYERITGHSCLLCSPVRKMEFLEYAAAEGGEPPKWCPLPWNKFSVFRDIRLTEEQKTEIRNLLAGTEITRIRGIPGDYCCIDEVMDIEEGPHGCTK